MDICSKIWRKLLKLRLQPIRVFCLHHVCKTFDADSMYECDWISIDEFKNKVMAMQQDGVEFILLTDAYRHIRNDWFRHKKYAVLTFDDGYASLKEILPWLEEMQIPVALFINGKYLDGKSYREKAQERYLSMGDLFSLTSSYIEIGSHGWVHTDGTKITSDEFKRSIEQNVALLQTHPNYIPCHAYTWGRHTKQTDSYLISQSILPVYIDGMQNYNDYSVIHRELL